MKREPLPNWGLTAIEALLLALNAKDPYTYGHCCRVGRNAGLLAKAAGLNEADQKIIQYAGLFHDLGKIGIPDSILQKPGRLTEPEEAVMRSHPLKSVEIIQPLCNEVPFFKSLIPGIRHHHEHMDGQGYPDALEGEKIPLVSRVILIVDTYDAMTTSRPYRKGMDPEIAYKEILKYSGRQFDPKLVAIFLKAHPKWIKEEPFRRAA